MKLIFFGSQAWAATLLNHLIDVDFFDVVAVVTQPDQPVGRTQTVTSSTVKRVALEKGCLVLEPEDLRDPAFLETIQSLHLHVGVVIAYGRIIPKQIIVGLPFGIVNVHPSLLPKWRGPSPVQAAIAACEETSGVTIMKIDEQIDHGPILAQTSIPIDTHEIPETFIEKVVAVSGYLLTQTLRQYVSGQLTPTPQDDTRATRCSLLTRQDGQIDWHLSAHQIDCRMRAYMPWPGSWTMGIHRGKPLRLKVLEAQMDPSRVGNFAKGTLFEENHELFVQTKTAALKIVQIQPEGKPVLSAKAFLSGYGDMLGQPLLSPREEK